jgi:hypothetical protein
LIPPAPLKGVLPPNFHYVGLNQWEKRQAYGTPDELVGAVNAQTEPGLELPEGVKTKNALKFWVWPVQNTFFPERYHTPVEDDRREHVIACKSRFTIKLNKRYRVHFWAKSDRNIELNFRWSFIWKEIDDVPPFYPPEFTTKSVSVGTGWSECSVDVRIDNNVDPKVTDWDFMFDFRFTDQPTLYIADLQIQEAM